MWTTSTQRPHILVREFICLQRAVPRPATAIRPAPKFLSAHRQDLVGSDLKLIRSDCRAIGKATSVRQNRSSGMARAGPNKTVLVPIANGSEEIEAVTIIDTLRRAGAEVTVASVEKDLLVSMSRQVKLVADKLISELQGQQYDLIALPGGMPGAERLRDSPELLGLLKEQEASDRYLTAICAAPAVILEAKGFLKGRTSTSHPGFTDKLSDQSNINTRVVVDGKIITSRGPGTALEFSLSLVHQLFGKEKAEEVAGPMVVSEGMKY